MPPSTSRARALIAAGALALVAPAVAGTTIATGQATGTTAAPQAAAPDRATLTARLADRHVRYGRDVVVSGRAAQPAAGQALSLEFRPRGGQWAPIARTTTRDGGAYRLRASVRRSGALRVVAAGEATAVTAASVDRARMSRELGIRVAAVLRATKVRRHVVGGRSATVRGRVLPAGAGRVVRLQVRRSGRWTTVDRDRTSGRGAYALRWRPGGVGRHQIRVRVSRDAATTATRRTLGRVNVYRSAHASWYGPGFYGGRTACGQTLGYGTLGVAHKTLPCGTKVTFRHRGRTVTVPVIDRGPFAAGREWDLTGATKRALGFGSTGNVLSTS